MNNDFGTMSDFLPDPTPGSVGEWKSRLVSTLVFLDLRNRLR